MGKYLGGSLPSNIFEFFHKKTMHGVVSTVDVDGFPRGAPMSLFYALDEKTMLMGAQNASFTFKNARERGKIALTFVGKGLLSLTIQGDTGVFKEKMENSRHMGILWVKIKSVKSDVADDVEVSEGIKTEFRSPQWQEFVINLLKELRTYTIEDLTQVTDSKAE